MPLYQLRLEIEGDHKYGPDLWMESIVGNVVVPIIGKGEIRRYWFTRYASPGEKRHVLFRFEHHDYSELQGEVEEICRHAGVNSLASIYDAVGDLGSDRFLAADSLQRDRKARSELVFSFLHGVAALFVNCLIPMNDGTSRFRLEISEHEQNPQGSVFESLHHLFCNATNVPTSVVVVIRGDSVIVNSPLYYSFDRQPNDEVAITRVRF